MQETDEKVSDLERKVESSVHGRRRIKDESDKISFILEEANKLLSELRVSTEDIKERRSDMERFIEDNLTTLTDLRENVKKNEDFMALYGYEQSQLPDLDLASANLLEDGNEVDRESLVEDAAPAAATEFPPPDAKASDEGSKGTIEPTSIFDIGLSKETLGIILGTSHKNTEEETKCEPDPPAACPPPDRNCPAPSEAPPMLKTTQARLMEDESLYAASPFLRGQARAFQLQDSYSDAELTPEVTRIAPKLSSNGLLRKASIQAQAKLRDVHLADNTLECGDTGECKALPTLEAPSTLKSSDTPELPNLETMDLHKVLFQSKLKTSESGKSQATPEEPILSFTTSRGKVTPEEPVLEFTSSNP